MAKGKTKTNKSTSKAKVKNQTHLKAKVKIKGKAAKGKATKAKPTKAKAKVKASPKAKSKALSLGAVKKKTSKVSTKTSTSKVKTAAAVSGKHSDSKSLLALVSKIVPLDDRVLIKPTLTERVTPGGLILPETSTLEGNLRGAVLAVGRGHQDKKGRVRPLDLRVGDEVLFSEYAGSPVEVSGEKLVILRETDILGVINR